MLSRDGEGRLLELVGTFGSVPDDGEQHQHEQLDLPIVLCLECELGECLVVLLDEEVVCHSLLAVSGEAFLEEGEDGLRLLGAVLVGRHVDEW